MLKNFFIKNRHIIKKIETNLIILKMWKLEENNDDERHEH